MKILKVKSSLSDKAIRKIIKYQSDVCANKTLKEAELKLAEKLKDLDQKTVKSITIF